MRDAATAADMSDPTLNRWFRRRWTEPSMPEATPVKVIALDELELTARELLAAWRRERAAGAREL